MRDFSALYHQIDSTTKTNRKVEAMAAYFRSAPVEDAVWALYFLTGRRPKRLIKRAVLKETAIRLAGVPDWLWQECYDAVGDIAETIAKILPEPTNEREIVPLHRLVEERILTLAKIDESEQARLLEEDWASMSADDRFVYNKLITGSFRVGVSRDLVLRALAQVFESETTVLAHKMLGEWPVTTEFYSALGEPTAATDLGQPYPFCLAHALEDTAMLGEPEDWSAEWKWDGIRAQIVRRGDVTAVWSRGEDTLHESFPEIVEAGARLPDGTVIDGEILAWNFEEHRPLSFGELQRRLGRKSPGKKLLSEVPALFLAFDLLEWEGEDQRERPWTERRALLEALVDPEAAPLTRLDVSPTVPFTRIEELDDLREQSREKLAEGLMLKRRDSAYLVGRKRGSWWKWKVAPFTVDAVLVTAQRGSGRRASLYTDYTFAVWDDGVLVPFAKAYSGLTDEEIRKVDNFVRRNTQERFGPVRSVTPKLVFEIAFEGIRLSSRHKSGVAVRFPRILRWRTDKKPEDADQLVNVRQLLAEREP